VKTKALQPFLFSIVTTLLVLLAVIFGLGWGAALTTLILIAIEITFSFDNAIINAKTLSRMSPFWQKLFLTVGIVIAIFGMRIVFPIVIVMLTAGLAWHQVINLALHHPHQYAQHLEMAHTSIAAFGGAFLLTLALYFFLDDAREVLWLQKIERPLKRFANWWLPLVGATVILLLAALMPLNHHPKQAVVAGLLGVVTYGILKLVVDGISKLVDGDKPGNKVYTGLAAFISFIYLEVLDASFSFDGVIGAFAITSMVVLIAAGLGVGAVWVRSLTVFMVKRGTLDAYKYLEHGAHYTVALLALLLLASLWFNIPDAINGGAGLVIIGLSLRASIIEKRIRG
jgi:hypothetical protein